MLLVTNTLCSNLHCQRGFNVILFSYKPIHSLLSCYTCPGITIIFPESIQENHYIDFLLSLADLILPSVHHECRSFPAQGIGAVSLTFEGKAPSLYEIVCMMNTCRDEMRARLSGPRSETTSVTVYQLDGLRKSAPPQIRLLIVRYQFTAQYVDDFVGELTSKTI